MSRKYKIALIGKFDKMHDEEYIARSFEMLGHEVVRIPSVWQARTAMRTLEEEKPDLLIFTKLDYGVNTTLFLKMVKDLGVTTVCWLFDLYFGYTREGQVLTKPFFRADYVVTTDGGHSEEWEKAKIKHFCVRQGIYKDECLLKEGIPRGLAFIGSWNPAAGDRNDVIHRLEQTHGLKWYGQNNTNEVRGLALNELFAETKIIVGDSVYSPHYWSNRVVETLGRGGFLIHRDVPGIREEYPHLVTHDGTWNDLAEKIEYYLEHEDERKGIVQKNFEWVRDNYTMDKKCQELLSCLNL